MSSIDRKHSQPRYWRSQDELTQSPEFQQLLKREFPESTWDELPPATRRQFLQVMGGSLALAGLTACRWPEEEIVPFAHRPAGVIPGSSRQFATAYELQGSSIGMLVTSYDGRPIKTEGNPLHPDSRGALSAIGQAQVLELYDPARSRRLVQRDQGREFARTWDEFAAYAREQLADESDGAGIAVLSEESTSPSVQRLRAAFLQRYPSARWVEFDSVSRRQEREGLIQLFGAPVRPIPDFSQAQVAACFDADPLQDHPSAMRLAKEFAAVRKAVDGEMVRLHVAETRFSASGAVADHRLAVAASEIPALILEVARLLVEVHGLSIPEAMLESAQTNLSALPQRSSVFAENVAVDLAEHEGEGVILVGPQQPATVHILAAAINQAVGSQGSTLRYVQEPWTDRQVGLTELGELVDLINSGEVQSLILLGGNPVYDGPRDLGLISLLEQVPFTVHLSLYRNETSKLCSWHLPRAHTLESWGDGTAWDGTWTCAQPLIAPLYGGKTSAELISLLLGDGSQTGHEIVRETFSQRFAELSFESGLHDGLIANSEFVEVDPPEFRTNADQVGAELSDLVAGSSNNAGIIEVVFRPDSKVFDGRFANSGWLQELPDSFTKVTWGNAALMSPQTARDLNLSDGEVIAISVGDQSVEIPTYVLPGHAPQCVSVSLGYGRTEAGEVGNGVGSNVYPLRTLQGMSHTRASVTGTGKHFQLATTQSHHAIDTQGFEARRGRIANLVREATLDEYLAHPDVIHHHDHHPPLVSLWKDQQYEGEQWGMAIDLSTCMGCSACVVACQAENNIPVVGREQVLNQREMHWLRVDRYFKTDEALTAEQVEDAEVSFQPVACVQCEMAPCEQVCPVAATQHTRDGLNAMVYNRCVGTRYCANNCPYKVRRFNFFNYRKDIPEIEQMQLNPEVTVRSRGVMEKCTYCVQRIEAVRISATNDRRPIRDGEITPACAQTCPTDAIVFGDLNDPDSEVSRLRQDQRSYATLAELNIRPRTHYLARIRNPRDDSSHSDGKESA